MPIYEYVCPDCEKEFECLVLGGDSDVLCPDCHGKDVQRLMSACSFKSSGSFTPPMGGGSSGCSSCSSSNCSSCH